MRYPTYGKPIDTFTEPELKALGDKLVRQLGSGELTIDGRKMLGRVRDELDQFQGTHDKFGTVLGQHDD